MRVLSLQHGAGRRRQSGGRARLPRVWSTAPLSNAPASVYVGFDGIGLEIVGTRRSEGSRGPPRRPFIRDRIDTMAGKGTGAEAAAPRITAHLLVIEARYYDGVGEALLAGAVAEMEASGVTWEVVAVPGALEIPQALSLALNNGLIPTTAEDALVYDGAIALGCVIRGETSHYDTVCEQSNHWLMETAVAAGIPLGNAILTVETEAQAMARAEGGRRGKGADAVRACLSLIRHARAFEKRGADV